MFAVLFRIFDVVWITTIQSHQHSKFYNIFDLFLEELWSLLDSLLEPWAYINI